MGFAGTVGTCLRKYVTFSGRASRSEYWWFFLFGILASIAAAVVDGAVFATATATETSVTVEEGPVGSLVGLALFLPNLAAGWRRMHDAGRPGWHLVMPMLILFGIGLMLALGAVFGQVEAGAAPEAGQIGVGFGVLALIGVLACFVSAFLVLWWLIRPSQEGENAYGPRPSA